jgi:hypothetical protein
MSTIYDTNSSFVFDKLVLSKPVQVNGGSYFIRCTVNNEALYIQPPKCCTKQGILKAGKRLYTDMMFANVNADFIHWMEKLEEHCQKILYANRVSWFEGDMEQHDIENYFTSPLKIFKSGKYYIARVNIPTVLGKPGIKIYDEEERELEIDAINENTNIMTILEIKGIKCSATCFQIEIEIKQLLVVNPTNVFDKCILKSAGIVKTDREIEPVDIPRVVERPSSPVEVPQPVDAVEPDRIPAITMDRETEAVAAPPLETVVETGPSPAPDLASESIVDSEVMIHTNEMEEVDVHLDELSMENSITIKNRNDVYYQMYREARRKAKHARDLALSSYLEAKRIKNTYLLDDIESSDDSDIENSLEE